MISFTADSMSGFAPRTATSMTVTMTEVNNILRLANIMAKKVCSVPMKVRSGGHLAAVQVCKTLGDVKCDMTAPIPPLQGAFAVLLYTLEEIAMRYILHYQ